MRGEYLFLSTPSARRATLNNNLNPPTRKISIHALREEGDHGRHLLINRSSISIHALREEGDRWGGLQGSPHLYFYPRPPRGGRLRRFERRKRTDVISIHALREEGDQAVPRLRYVSGPISIHALREEGDQRYGDRILWQYISIHALREEGDRCSCRP